MKRTYIALLVSSLAVFTPQAWADDCQDDQPPGGPIQGIESLDAKVIMVATSNAPAGACGVAKLEADNDDGVQTATLSVKTRGLNPGDYILSIVKQSDGSSLTLGQITIGTAGTNQDGHCHDGNDDDSHDGEDSQECHEKCYHESDTLESESEVQLPSDLNVMDIAQIVLSDSNGNAILVGDLVNPAKKTIIKFKGNIQITPGEGAPGAKGKALLRSVVRKGKRTNGFALSASGVPAGASFALHMNGQNVGTVNSSKKGKVTLRKLPATLSTVRSVRLMDAQGKAAASAHF